MTTTKRYTIAEIKAVNAAGEGHFFDRDTLRHYKERMRDWSVLHRGGRVFIRRNTDDQVREFDPATGRISLPCELPA